MDSISGKWTLSKLLKEFHASVLGLPQFWGFWYHSDFVLIPLTSVIQKTRITPVYTPAHSNLLKLISKLPITVAARSKAWTVFVRSNAGIVGSNPTQDIDVCLCLFCVCMGSDLATGLFPIRGVLPTLLGLRNWSETKRFMDVFCSKVRTTGKRERENQQTVKLADYFHGATILRCW
jgi:hypothetical protein